MEQKLPEKLQQIGDLLPWEQFEVKNDETAETAGAALSEIKKRRKEIDDYRLGITAPIKKGIRALEEHCKRFTDPLDNLDKMLRGKIASYWNLVQAQKDAEAKKAREAEIERQKLLLKEANKEAFTTGSEDAIAATQTLSRDIEKLQSAPQNTKQTIRTGQFTIGHSEVWEWTITNLDEIPRAFLIVDEKRLNAIAKTYGTNPVMVKGVEFKKTAKVIVQK